MTQARYFALFERLAELPTSRAVLLFIQNELQPHAEDNDDRFRSLMHAARERYNYARAAGR